MDAVRFSVDPAQTAPPFPAVTLGITLTLAVVVDAGLVHPFNVTVTEYTPVAAVVALGMDGFCSEETNPFGPVQLYEAPLTVEFAVSAMVIEQAWVPPVAVISGAVLFSVTVTLADPEPELLVATTV